MTSCIEKEKTTVGYSIKTKQVWWNHTL